MKTYQNQKKTPDLEDIQEFNKIMKDSVALIKKAILEETQGKKSSTPENDQDQSDF